MELAPFFVTLALLIPAELPDKTFVATLVLSTRFSPRWVFLGVSAAFAVQTTIAVAAGQLFALLPELPVQLVTAALFAVGAVVMFRGAAAGDSGGCIRSGAPSGAGITWSNVLMPWPPCPR